MPDFHDISLGYDGQVFARGISVSVHPGECILLAGPNGAGKTTLLRALAGRGAAMIPTGIPKVKGFTVREFILTSISGGDGLLWASRRDRNAVSRTSEALSAMGMDQMADRDISALSDGEFQKACIAAALARKADILLLDEPTAFLDAGNRADVLKTLRNIASDCGIIIIFTSHDIHAALRAAHRVWVMTGDHRLLTCPPLSPREALEEAFGKDITL